MIYPATQEISNYFTMRDVKHIIGETDTMSYVEAGFNGKVVKGVVVRFFSSSERSDISARVANFGGGTVPKERREDVLEVLNSLNCRFRFIKFCIHAGETISVEYDICQSTPADALGEMCREIFIRFIQVLDEAYPIVMKALWG